MNRIANPQLTFASSSSVNPYFSPSFLLILLDRFSSRDRYSFGISFTPFSLLIILKIRMHILKSKKCAFFYITAVFSFLIKPLYSLYLNYSIKKERDIRHAPLLNAINNFFKLRVETRHFSPLDIRIVLSFLLMEQILSTFTTND